MGTQKRYSEQDIEVLEGLEAVRKRPGMYIGGADVRGYHHLLWEIVDNAIDEAINGHASSIHVTLHKDGTSATVEDDGRGIPTGIMPKYGKPALEVILTTLHSGAKFQSGSYTHAGGLHGVGSSVVNALSSTLYVRVKHDGSEVEQSYARGIPTTPLIERKKTRSTGTSVFFRPDADIFGPDLRFDATHIVEQLEAKSYLHKGLRIVFEDEISKEKKEFLHKGGISDYLTKALSDKQATALHPALYLERTLANGLRFECALAWTETAEEWNKSFVNGIPTPHGGTHELGLRSGVVKGIRHYLEVHHLVPKGVSISSEDVREGWFALLSCYVLQPQFQGQTKEKLNNPEVQPEIDGAVRTAIESWLNSNPSSADAIVQRIVQAARAREAAKAASQAVSRKTGSSGRVSLPGKLADCTSNRPEECELFIVEGDSAGGSAKQGRDRRTQAILSLRGKVLNTEQASLGKLLSNKELQDILATLGCGLSKDYDERKLRYHRIFLLMDADSDGYHIATLLLTFFYRHLPQLIQQGHIYLAQPPLYRIDIGKETHWVSDDTQKAALLASLPPSTKVDLQRFKGLGEMMPKQLWETTLDPKRRRSIRITIDDAGRTDQLINDLMGKDTAARFRFIMERASQAIHTDL